MSPEVGALRYLRRVLDDPAVRGVSDADLLHRFVAHRDESAFELLLWRHAGMVMRACRAVLRDHHLAEDAFQSTFLALARKAPSITRHAVLAGWLYRVAHNAALKARARQLRDASEPLATEPAAPAAGPEDPALLHEELGRLPDKYRTPLVLCFLEGQTHEDAARLLGWPRGTVAARVARGKDLLRQRLTRRGLQPGAALGTLAAGSSQTVSPALVSTTLRASLAFASGGAGGVVSVSVLRLTEGVLHSMFLSKLKSIAVVLCIASGVVLGGLALGGWALAQKPAEVRRPSPVPSSGPAPREAEEGRAAGKKLRQRSIDNLKHIALAVHAYHDVYDRLPDDIRSVDKKPLLSWRVALLPFLDQEVLHKQFKLDEPWDSEHNFKLLSKIPDVYRTGTEGRDSAGTYYQAFTGVNTLFPGGQVRMSDITDGTSNTILAIEAGKTVPWTKPADLPYSPDKPLPPLGGPFPEVIHTAFADGSVHSLRRDFDEKEMRVAIIRNDGLILDRKKLLPPASPESPKPRKAEEKPTLEEALREVRAQRARANEEVRRATILARQAEAQAVQAQAQVEQARRQSEELKRENERLKAALRDVAAQLNKLVPPEKADSKPGGEVKALAAELERTQAELRQLREKVERLEKALGK